MFKKKSQEECLFRRENTNATTVGNDRRDRFSESHIVWLPFSNPTTTTSGYSGKGTANDV